MLLVTEQERLFKGSCETQEALGGPGVVVSISTNAQAKCCQLIPRHLLTRRDSQSVHPYRLLNHQQGQGWGGAGPTLMLLCHLEWELLRHQGGARVQIPRKAQISMLSKHRGGTTNAHIAQGPTPGCTAGTGRWSLSVGLQ